MHRFHWVDFFRASQTAFVVFSSICSNTAALAAAPDVRTLRVPAGFQIDVLVTPDGALLISDDGAGAIYRVRYQP